MKVTVTFSPTLKNVPNGQGHRITGDLDVATQLLWVTCPVSAHAPAGKFAIHVGSRAIIAPLPEASKQAGAANQKGEARA